MDAKLRVMVANEVREAVTQALEGANEVWLTGEQLTKQFAFFTKSWLKSYGHTLPRTQAVVFAKDGEHRTGWCYPQHKIQRMVQNGEIKTLKTTIN